MERSLTERLIPLKTDSGLKEPKAQTSQRDTPRGKIKPEHYQYMLSEIGKVATPEMIAIHRRFIQNENKAKDVEKRLRWDFSYSARLGDYIFANVYPYADDTHIDTALRSIIKTLEASNLNISATNTATT